MQALSEREKIFWIEFLEIYQNKTALWKVKSREYKDKTLKNHAYQDLVEKLKEINVGADREMVKKKINNFRSSYRREVKRLNAKLESSAAAAAAAAAAGHTTGGDCTVTNPATAIVPVTTEFTSSLWYFKHMEFLRDQLLDDEQSHNSLNDEITTIMQYSDEYLENEFMGGEQPPPIKKERIMESPSGEMKLTTANSSDNDSQQAMICTQLHPQFDEADVLGKSWSYQYRDLTKEQQLFARKAIEDIFFEAKLGTLHRNSIRINEVSNNHHHHHSSSYPIITYHTAAVLDKIGNDVNVIAHTNQ